jgi:hypothetical protein
LVGTFAPDLGPRTARPVLIVLADRTDLREAARGWEGRVDVHAAEIADRPADALLIRPDAHVAWAAALDEPAATAAPALHAALDRWFGAPMSLAGAPGPVA